MDTSSSNPVDNTDLETLILASIQSLKRNKKYGSEEFFQHVLESLKSNIRKESFDKKLELLTKN